MHTRLETFTQWSRFSGGSGAPYWTLLACGIHPPNITPTQSAIIHSEYPYTHSPSPSSLPAMLWSTNYGRLLSQTMFTLFFAGKEYAPKCVIDGVNVQEWLQAKYLGAIAELAKKIAAWEGEDARREGVVIGWDSMNEPFEGLVGWDDLNINPTGQGSTLKKGTHPSPAQSLRLGMGQAQTVDNYKFGALGPQQDGTVTIDPKGLKVWGTREELGEDEQGYNRRWGWKRGAEWEVGSCIWANHGVWDIETGFMLRPDYFRYRASVNPGSPNGSPRTDELMVIEEVEFIDDFWKPHWLSYSSVVRMHLPLTIIFVQPSVFAPPPRLSFTETHGRCAYSPHYYDGLTLVSRHWGWMNADALGLLRGKYKGRIGGEMLSAVKFGERAIRKSLREQIGYLKDDVAVLGNSEDMAEKYGLGMYPTLIGEIGTPFDMDDKKSYGFSSEGRYLGDYSSQEKALDASLNACDGERAVNWTVWPYVGDDHSHEWGDGWNMEDLSLWSLGDLVERPQGGGSAVTLCGGSVGNGKSTTTLVPSSVNTSAASSALNLLDVRLTRRVYSDPRRQPHPYSRIRGYTLNPFIFLTNGARAYRAFSRPRPVTSVGVPESVEFDMGKGVFRLRVKVGRDDVVALGEERDGETHDEGRATEVFLPLVHYANADVVNDAFRIWREGEGEEGTETDSNTVVDVEIGPNADKEASCLIGDTYRLVYPSVDGRKCVGEEVALVDVDVWVSHGKFRVVGQRLLWWYSEAVGEQNGMKVDMEVKRRGGPLKVVDWRKVGSTMEEQEEVDEKGVCEKICDEDGPCIIA